MTDLEQRIDKLRELFPFKIVQSDSIHRLTPGSKQVLNSNEAWLVSQPCKSAHKLKAAAPEMMQVIEELQSEDTAMRETIKKLTEALEFYTSEKCYYYPYDKDTRVVDTRIAKNALKP